TTIAVHPAAGWVVKSERLVSLTPLGDGPEPRFQATQQRYEGTFALRPAAPAPMYQALTTAEPRGTHVTVTTALLGWLDRGDFPQLTVHWRNWHGSAPQLQAPSALRQHHRQNGNDHTWTVQLPPGSARMVLLQLFGQIESGKPFPLPRVEIEGGQLVEQQVAWPQGALLVQDQRGLKEVKASAATG